MRNILLPSLVLLLSQNERCQARPPLPVPYTKTNPDSTTCTMTACGGEWDDYRCDLNHYTVLGPTESGHYVYAKLNEETCDLEESDCVCGACDPSKHGLSMNARPCSNVVRENFCSNGFCDFDESAGNPEEQQGVLDPALAQAKKMHEVSDGQEKEVHGNESNERKERKLDHVKTVMPNLVVLFRFSDHSHRVLPEPAEYTKLFNEPNCNVYPCHTGSVYDFYMFNSYGELAINSVVYPQWIDVPNTEAYYADGQRGRTRKISEAMIYALEVIDDDENFDFKDFDLYQDGKIDSITFIHSGFDAAYSATDCFGTNQVDRINSHKWYFRDTWMSSDGVSVQKYNINNGISGTGGAVGNCITNFPISTIGGLTHELAHFFGLPDLYDSNGGVGMGAWDVMSNCWGFTWTDEYPPMFSPWSKKFFGWIDPVPIKHDGTYKISAAHSEREFYVISDGYAAGESILIENRQPVETPYQFEKHIPGGGGLLMYHIDDNVNNNEVEGHPGQLDWPQNGKHYKVAVMQADGQFALETGSDWTGDAGDLFRGDGVHSIGPDGTSDPTKLHPNLNGYAHGDIVETGYKIDQISMSGYDMTFRFTGMGAKQAGSDPFMLESSFHGGNSDQGNMFDVFAKTSIIVKALDIHTTSEATIQVMIYTRDGSYVGHEQNSASWTYHGIFTVTGQGFGNPTRVSGFDHINLSAESITGFYVTLKTDELEYSSAGTVGEVFAENDHLAIIPGCGNNFLFQEYWTTRLWNGNIIYELDVGQVISPPATTTPPTTTTITPTTTTITPATTTITPATTTTTPTTTTTTTTTTTADVKSGDGTGWAEDVLDAGWESGNGASGSMFDIKPKSDIEVRDFDVHCNSAGDKKITIYTKEGSYKNYEQNSDAWDLLCSQTIPCNAEGVPTKLPPGCVNPVPISADTTQAFYITFDTKSIKYTNGNGEGTVAKEDDHLVIYEGVGVSSPWGRKYAGRKFNGNIYYAYEGETEEVGSSTPAPTPSPTPAPTPSPTPPQATPAPTPSPTPAPTPSPTPAPTPSPTPAPTPSPTPAPTPSPTPAPTPSPTPAPTPSPTPALTPSPTPANETPLKTLRSMLDGSTVAKGKMFQLRASNRIEINSFDFNCDQTAGQTVNVKVFSMSGSYEGHQRDEGKWDLICEDATLPSIGKNEPTPIPPSSCDGLPIVMEQGELRSFYISLSTQDVVFSEGNPRYRSTYKAEFDVSESNDDLQILTGSAMLGYFQTYYVPKVGQWNGQVNYRTLA